MYFMISFDLNFNIYMDPFSMVFYPYLLKEVIKHTIL